MISTPNWVSLEVGKGVWGGREGLGGGVICVWRRDQTQTPSIWCDPPPTGLVVDGKRLPDGVITMYM